ncbi:MAG TPA: hypothetical protein VGO52_15985 [Hyphomonadaceae bacterium]|jgi:hypothetical protein|nr:hypothetical protein [Hyphomonadaceae bacterium]
MSSVKWRRAALLAAMLAAAPALAQTPSPYTAPRNSLGQPDLGGLWTNATRTEFERAPQYGDRAVMTPEEVSRLQRPAPPQAPGAVPPPADTLGARIMQINGEYRTSFLVEPKNGRLPALTPEAERSRLMKRAEAPRGVGYSRGENVESLTYAERCLKDFGSSSGPPMLPVGYNNTYQIVQAPEHVAILIEMIHDVRIVPLTRDRKRPSAVKQWMGDSIGWYEGDTLVVETTNFRPGAAFNGVSESMKLVEKFRRISDSQIVYSFEINEPKIFTAPIKGELAWNATSGPLYEYACHEGNYSLANMLSGQRTYEAEMAAIRTAAEKKRKN